MNNEEKNKHYRRSYYQLTNRKSLEILDNTQRYLQME